ncbi:MAG: glycerate kinase [Gammaproteobacteria bacterium]|nr:MAG: glycerate kinase [Gammaproteobacteria bacterium]
MRVLLAPNALKGSLEAVTATQVMAEALAALPFPVQSLPHPVADGGDGTLDVLAATLDGARMQTATVEDALGRPVTARFLSLAPQRLAVLEAAEANGLRRLRPEERDAWRASSRGVGQLVRAALDAGARRLVIGIGGSATSDGGLGMLQALGVDLRDPEGRPVPGNGAGLERVAHIETKGLDPRLAETTVEVLCDVDNPLFGPHGAAYVYAPQKGADAATVARLDAGLRHFAARLRAHLGRDVAGVPGAGAAGGLGAALLAFLQARLVPGAERILELTGFDAHLEACDLVLTAEGRLDTQTAQGKAPAVVARRAAGRGLPCFALAGALAADAEALHAAGFTALFPLVPGPVRLEEAMRAARANLARATREAVRAFAAGGGRLPRQDPG